MAEPRAIVPARPHVVTLPRDQRSFSVAFQAEAQDILQKAQEIERHIDDGMKRALELAEERRRVDAEMETVLTRNEACDRARMALNERLHLLNKQMDLQERDVQKMRAEEAEESLVNRLQRELDELREVAKEVSGKICHCKECAKQCRCLVGPEEREVPAADPPVRPNFAPELSSIVVDL